MRRTRLTLQKNFSTQDGFDTLAPGFLVKLDGAEEIIEIGDGERGLTVLGSRLGHLIDSVGPVNDGKFGVQAQMNKHAGIVERPASRSQQTPLLPLS